MDDSAIQPQPAPSKPFPGFAQALLVLFLFLFFSGLAGIPAGILKALGFSRTLPWMALLGQLGGTALTLRVCTTMGHQKWRDYFPHHAVAPAVWPLVLLGVLGLILLSNGMDGLLQKVLPMPSWLNQAFENMGWPGLVVGAPLTEEPLLRGVLLGGFLLRYGPRKAIAYSALLFALIHMNPWQFPTALMAGLFLGWLVIRTGSLWPAVFAHFLNNLGSVLCDKFHAPYLSGGSLQPLWMWVLGAVLVGVAIGALHRVMSHPVLAEALP